jgi:hypothetical protein
VSIPVVENLPQRNGTLGKIYLNVERRPVENLPQGSVLLVETLPQAKRHRPGAEAKARQIRKPESVVENLPQQNEPKVRDKIGEIAGVLP